MVTLEVLTNRAPSSNKSDVITADKKSAEEESLPASIEEEPDKTGDYTQRSKSFFESRTTECASKI